MKRLLTSLLALGVVTLRALANDGFAIVIDPKSYNEARAEVTAYASAIEKYNNLKVFTVVDRWGVPDSIRAELIRLHSQKQAPVVGAVFIGDIPVPMLRDAQHLTSAFKMNQKQPREESSVPSDRYYDDFGLKFKFIDKDKDKPYFYYSLTAESQQAVRPDLFSGRIRPTDTGGTSRYEKLRAYLRKAVAQKEKARRLDQLFFFSGHGYVSDSKVARMDEKAAYFEHFPWLNDRRNHISYIDHNDQNPVKERLMNEVMRTDLDLAVLHHHGYFDTQYLNGAKKIATVREAKEYIIRNAREHVYAAKQKGKNADSIQTVIQKRFDLPDTWLENALNDSVALADSTYEAAADLHLEDFGVYGYKPNAPVVVIDACFCGSFHLDDCIADEYIFQPGTTVAVVANTVNVLQDKWSDRLIGLTALGGTIGDLSRFSTFLESHVIGDPTYAFTPSVKGYDINHLLLENKNATWKKLLRAEQPEIQSLAIDQLTHNGAITSKELLGIYENAPQAIVRLQALQALSAFRDDNFIKAVEEASQDRHEYLQRLAIRYMAQSGDERLIPALIRLSISNNTSDRCNFNASTALSSYPKEKLMAEFARQYDSPSIRYIRKDSVRAVIANAITRGADRVASMALGFLDSKDVTAKERMFSIRAMRNNLPHYLVPRLLDYCENDADADTQVQLLEMLGWHKLSCQAGNIAERALAISKNEKYEEKVREEALKTYNRIHAK